MKMEFCSQRIEMCVLGHRHGCHDVTCKPAIRSCVTSYCVTMFSLFTSSTLFVTGYCYCSLVTVEVREDKI